MLSNYELCIVGDKCVLVPYRPEHVETYHGWMKDPDLLEATGSEPLTMEEEIAMQVSWRDDPKKCTFIVLAKNECNFLEKKELAAELQDYPFVERNLDAMVGDVNLFLSEVEDEDEDQTSQSANDRKAVQAELDIMIASQRHRGQGIGQEACLLMMMYGARHHNIQRFFSKINKSNTASKSLFERKLGFYEVCFVEVFQQFELERKAESAEKMSAALRKDLALKENDQVTTFQCPLYKS